MPTDELIHGLTAVELQALTAKCLEARERAYCKFSDTLPLAFHASDLSPALNNQTPKTPSWNPAVYSVHTLTLRAPPYIGPYSLFRVGASLLIRSPSSSLSSPTIITGANVENAAYPVGTCAERVAMGTAVVQGYQYGDVKAVGVATDLKESCSPCGMCRQFLREFLEVSGRRLLEPGFLL